MKIPHNEPLDVAIYQTGFGGGKTWAGSLLGISLAKKYPGSRGMAGAATFTLLERTTLTKYLEHLDVLGYKKNINYTFNASKHLIKFDNGLWILLTRKNLSQWMCIGFK